MADEDPSTLQLVIKNPSKDSRADFSLSVQASSSLGQVKQLLQRDYTGNPSPDVQTLIYAGKVLKEDQKALTNIFTRAQEPGIPHTLHLVVKSPPPERRFSGDVPQPSLQGNLPRAGSTPPIPPVASASSAPEQAPFNFHSTPGPSGQASEAAFGNPFAQNPALAAAYNAAFAALSNHNTSFPDLSQLPPGNVPLALGGQLGPGPPTNDHQARPMGQFMSHYPTYSIPLNNAAVPSMAPHPAFMPQQPAPAPAPASSQAASSNAASNGADAATSAPSGSAQASSSSSAEPSTSAQPTQQPLQQQQPQPAGSQPFYAPPAFAYVPVSLVSSMPVHSNASIQQQQQPGQQPGAQQMPIGAMSYPLQPILPVAVPYGVYHPYPPPAVLPPQAGHPNQQQQHQPYVGQQQYNAVQMQQQQLQGQFQAAGGFPPMAGPHFGVAMVRHPVGAQQAQIAQAVAAAAAGHLGPMGPAGIVPPGGQPRRQIRVRLFRVNLRVALQLMVLAGILWQHCPPGRFFLIMGVASLLYLAGFAPFRNALQRILGVAEGGAVGNARPAGGNPPAANAPRAAPAGILRELHALVVGFFTSLLPGWNVNPEDAAAFAAAQQQVAMEALGEGAAANGNDPAVPPQQDRPHQD